ECLPVAVIEGRELQATRAATEAGAGTCVGRPVAPNEVRIIAITDEAIADWSQVRELPVGSVGEITVAGPTATDAYFNRPRAMALAKIRERRGDGGARIVHRMGDLGYFDAEGRLWFCGRKSQRVETAHGPLYTEQVEPVFNAHPAVRRSALVGVGERGAQRAVVIIESPERRQWERRKPRKLLQELRESAAGQAHTANLDTFLFHPAPPVDIRHNAKIQRERLAVWAARRLPSPESRVPSPAP